MSIYGRKRVYFGQGGEVAILGGRPAQPSLWRYWRAKVRIREYFRPDGEVATRRSAKPLLGGCNSRSGLI